MPLDHFMQVVGHRKDVALLALEQLKLLIERVRDVGDNAAESFLAAHWFINKKPPARRPRARTTQGIGSSGGVPCMAKKLGSRLPLFFRAEVHGDLADGVGAPELRFPGGDPIQRLDVNADTVGGDLAPSRVKRL
jgi:hypothetical protein